MKTETLAASLTAAFGERLGGVTVALDEITAVVPVAELVDTMRGLRDRPEFSFATLIDLCGVDYSAYGGEATGLLYTSSDATPPEPIVRTHPGRFAVVYHLLSLTHNTRVRVRSFAADDDFPVLLPRLEPRVLQGEPRERVEQDEDVFPGHDLFEGRAEQVLSKALMFVVGLVRR